ncbi:cytochrome-c peroxidase [Engelhardtia mirabilis]|uniref:Cytochrome c551 peroxidase n=1 Tax=Engelhardtia mirabilis TaxID=2528011 RepID=A0A518BRL9_9BACT|nr:Cytochrome c551 peroxidase precursor [Planctomycetes bacterium Pla133]QDV03926.1 Cytochrome c551 peroxidase precursor [Planctomycetes bacterium Pla86]
MQFISTINAANAARSLPLALIAAASLAACSGGNGAVETPLQLQIGSVDPQLAQIDLGRKFFFDERTSAPQGVSCGMCHNPSKGWGDDRPQGKGVQDHTLAGDVDGDGMPDHEGTLAVAGNYFKTILTPRNTPTIYNAHVFPNIFWDGRAGDLVHQAQFPVEAGFEMNTSWDAHVLPMISADPEYTQLLTDAYGDGAATKQRLIEAIGAYEATISVFDTPFDDYEAGKLYALNKQEKRGHKVFFGKGGCFQCHPAPLLTTTGYANTGVPTAGSFALNGGVDLGRGVYTDLTQDPPVDIDNPADYAKFKIPQLRMVGVTGPYMHNGAFSTLEEVVEFYDQGGGPDLSGTGTKDPRIVPLGLSPGEKAALVAFLEFALTGDEIK